MQTASMEVKKKTITNDTTHSNIPWGKMSLHLLIMNMKASVCALLH
jgi:hypothetical protein